MMPSTWQVGRNSTACADFASFNLKGISAAHCRANDGKEYRCVVFFGPGAAEEVLDSVCLDWTTSQWVCGEAGLRLCHNSSSPPLFANALAQHPSGEGPQRNTSNLPVGAVLSATTTRNLKVSL